METTLHTEPMVAASDIYAVMDQVRRKSDKVGFSADGALRMMIGCLAAKNDNPTAFIEYSGFNVNDVIRTLALAARN